MPPPAERGRIGTGAGVLSAAALARRARSGASHLPLAVPDLSDLAAVAAWRAAVHATWGEDDDPIVTHERTVVGGVQCLEAGRSGDPLVVYAHGGGHCLGSPEVSIPITARLAASGLRVVSVRYRLAPEDPHPAAFDDVLAVARALTDEHGPIALVGDSAGGGLALLAALALVADRRRPACVALAGPLLAVRSDDPLQRAYLGATSADDPGVSPLHADPSGLPPVLVQMAAGEPLLGDAARFTRFARACGADAVLDVWDGLWHTWHYHRDLPEADRALAEIASFVRSHVTASRGGSPVTRRSVEIEGFAHRTGIPVATRLGPILASSVIAPFEPGTRDLPAAVGDQVRNVFTHAAAMLAAGGATWDDVVKMTFYVGGPEHREAVEAVWLQTFPDPASRPARHTLVLPMADGGPLVTADFLAYVDHT